MEASHLASWRRTVLVVDDHSSVRETLGLILGDAYDVLFAEDGPPALALLTSRRVDAVLLDLGLRDMDGFEVLARMQSILPRLPVIILTVRSSAADVVRALKLGASDYLTKPLDEETVQSKLAEALSFLTPLAMEAGNEGKTSIARARLMLTSPASYDRPRCLVVAGHVGTASVLRVIFDRYVPTNASMDCFFAAQV